MSLRPAAPAPDAPDAALPPPAWRGGAETGALVVAAPASRLHLVLAAGQRSAETSGKAAKAKENAQQAVAATAEASQKAVKRIKEMYEDFKKEENKEKRAQKGARLKAALSKVPGGMGLIIKEFGLAFVRLVMNFDEKPKRQ